MKLDTALPWQTSNTIMIFICILILLWLFRAMKRFQIALHLRRAVLNHGVIPIQGLSSYLSYFDGATGNHFHSIVHTRQPKPPTKMNVLYVPYTLQKAKMTTNLRDKITYEFQLFTTIPGKLLFLINYNTGKLRQTIDVRKQEQQSNMLREGITYQEVVFGLDQQHFMNTPTQGIKIHRLPTMLSGKEYAHGDCFIQECVLGLQTVQFHMPFPKSPNQR
jgi:hypothetical protein